ncbi:hypothetical protein [Ornithinibacillus contaminans]|nr:hypothetical protein [Ornithinibacillus contaminans]
MWLERVEYRSLWRDIARYGVISLVMEQYRSNWRNIAQTGEISLELA